MRLEDRLGGVHRVPRLPAARAGRGVRQPAPSCCATLARIDGRMAWTGNSEVAKGLHSACGLARSCPVRRSLVFITDGHEAPPLNPRHRPAFDDKSRAARWPGSSSASAATTPVPIPKTDPSGRPLGFWRADDVLQTDPRSHGRGGSVPESTMAEDGDVAAAPALPRRDAGARALVVAARAVPAAARRRNGLRYHRLRDVDALLAALTDASLRRDTPGAYRSATVAWRRGARRAAARTGPVASAARLATGTPPGHERFTKGNRFFVMRKVGVLHCRTIFHCRRAPSAIRHRHPKCLIRRYFLMTLI